MRCTATVVRPVSTRYLVLAALVVAAVILAAGAVFFLVTAR
jgi:hypothetical protein